MGVRPLNFKVNIMSIIFNEELHTYTHATTGAMYTPVSTIIAKFYTPFDEEYFSLYKAIERHYGTEVFLKAKAKYGFAKVNEMFLANAPKSDLEAADFLAEVIRTEWKLKADLACEKGTAYHLEEENKVIAEGYTWNGKHYPYRAFQFGDELKEDDCFVVTELIIWHDESLICGTADLVIFDCGKIHILDHKTNEELKDNDYKQMLGVFNQINDSSVGHYTVQLSIYLQMLLIKYPWCKAGNTVLLHWNGHFIHEKHVPNITHFTATLFK